MNKIEEMTDAELKKAWTKGVNWLNAKSQSWGDKNKAIDGTPYNHRKFLLGLRRLESIEDEAKKRGLEL